MNIKMNEIRELEIKCGLFLAGETMSSIARELGVTPTHIQNVVKGKRESLRVSRYLEDVAVPVQLTVVPR